MRWSLIWLGNYPVGTIDNYLIIHTIAIPSAGQEDIGVRMTSSQFIFEELVGEAEICFPPIHPGTSQSRTLFGSGSGLMSKA